jgi:hypothetical protein
MCIAKPAKQIASKNIKRWLERTAVQSEIQRSTRQHDEELIFHIYAWVK